MSEQAPTSPLRDPSLLLLIAWIGVVLAAHWLWLWADTRPQPLFDANAYYAYLLRSMDQIAVQGRLTLAALTDLSVGGRPPLYQLSALPLILLLGRSADAALVANLLYAAVMLASVYAIGRRLRNGWTGLLAAVILAAYPTIANLTHIFRPHYALPAWVALALYLLLRMLDRRTPRSAWLLCLVCAAGMLTHPVFPLLVIAPIVAGGVYTIFLQTPPHRPAGRRELWPWLRAKLADPFFVRGLLPAALVASLLIAAWYLTLGQMLWKEIENVNLLAEEAGGGAIVRGFEEGQASVWWYALTAPGALSTPFALLLLFALIFPFLRKPDPYVLLLVGAVLCAYIIAAGRVGYSWYVMAGILPVAALLSAVALVDIPRPVISRGLIALTLLLAAFNLVYVLGGAQPWNRAVAAALGSPVESLTCSQMMNVVYCPWPPVAEDWGIDQVLADIAADPACQEQPCRLTVVTPHKAMQFYHFYSFFAAALRDRPADAAVEVVLARSLQDVLESDYVLYVNRRAQNLPVLAYLQARQRPFLAAHRLVNTYALPGGVTSRLLARTRPLTRGEAVAVLAWFDLPPEQQAEFQPWLDKLPAP